MKENEKKQQQQNLKMGFWCKTHPAKSVIMNLELEFKIGKELTILLRYECKSQPHKNTPDSLTSIRVLCAQLNYCVTSCKQ